MIEDRERKIGNEIITILIKAVLCGVLVYFHSKQIRPDLYLQYPNLENYARGLLTFLGPSLAVSILRLIVIYWYIRKHKFKNNIKDNFILGINRIVSILNTLFFLFALIVFFGSDPKEFITSISIVAAAIALTFKDYVTNMINGLIIMFSDRLSLGDHIKIGDNEGKILDITLINMILQNEDSDMVIVPNSIAFSSVIINQSKQNTKKLSIEFDMSLDNGYTPEYLENHLNKVIEGYTANIIPGGLTVKTIAINKDVAVFKAMVLLKHYDKLKEREITRSINTALLRLSASLKKEEQAELEKVMKGN
ncbi:mechanosensitive ion channel family protein [Pedobacter metabolipauper]|uniref:Mechanosensitive ion channel-like protein n=1 Tax=Pedobacter metabolipauper TaxID=425513 RepID=A0A4R6SP77_9SPHI|nr:mechanosensitive ion channel domain-containing protein [Pedobacter metabolipauper]TDQ06391.1 mechanosensitive ion channel-like protein [Pedobacter metabolipauper]